MFIKSIKISYYIHLIWTRATYAGGAGGARITLHTKLFPSLLSCKGPASGVVDSLVQENFSGGKPPDPQLHMVY